MAIAYSIFIGTKDGDVLRFTSGEKDDFEITGLNSPLGPKIRIFADTKLNDIYIMDPTNRRLVVINDSGELMKQYKTDKAETWSDMKDIAISDDERYAYVLNGSKIYIIGLEVETPSEESEE